ncbi:hypothetical protein GIB67_029796 [Kingdonia uniflora]|uniref:Pentatricopeptide repeat-containing protein n=1 Tax=Kingdonia uniflora TaxID=39325 RepID=A0A7J7NJT6_9MAGN|nr:hypothetical protein GIB67_029796 [Kingdonia uniflora]
MPEPDTFIYNTLIRGCMLAQMTQHCVLTYTHMLEMSVWPNNFTFPTIVKACCSGASNAVREGEQVHAHVFKFGFWEDTFSQNSFIHMYLSFGFLDEARPVFDNMGCPDVVLWTILIAGYAKLGFVDEAYKVFELMPGRNAASAFMECNYCGICAE